MSSSPQTRRGNGPAAAALVVLAVIFAVLAVLYAVGVMQLFASATSGPHYKHAAVLAVLTVASLIAANFMRPQS